MRLLKTFPLFLAFLFIFSESAFAQRGMGDQSGIVRQGLQTEPATITGTLKEIQTERCENTTGGGLVGTHLIIETDAGEEANVHLGFASAVARIVDQFEPGQEMTIEAFRTEQMPESAYVAKSISAGGEVYSLRDDSLRPMWAGGAGIGNGQWTNARPGRRPGGRGWSAGRGGPRGGGGRCWAW